MNNWISTDQMPWLESYMDLAAIRQRLIANNLANIDTPGFTTQDINFEREFARALASAAPAEPAIQDLRGLVARPDGNNVNLDRETALLAETQIRFQIGSQLLRRQFLAVRNSIQEGRNL